MYRGYIKAWRKCEDNPIFDDPLCLALWIRMLWKATHKPYKTYWNGKEIILQPGQFIAGRHSLSEKSGINESKIRRILKRFKTGHQIDQQITNRSSLFTIINYKEYQQTDQLNGQQTTSKRPASGQPVTTNNNIITKEQKKKEYHAKIKEYFESNEIEDHKATWRKAYKGVDIEKSLENSRAFLLTAEKQYKNLKSFCNNSLKRDQSWNGKGKNEVTSEERKKLIMEALK